MSKARVIVAAVVLEGQYQGEIARQYDISQSTVSRYVARFREEGEEESCTGSTRSAKRRRPS